MDCKKANVYVMRSNQAMTCCNMKAITTKKPLLKSDENWQHKDTPIVKRESDETATKSSSSARQLKFMNALSRLRDILRANETSNRVKDSVTKERSPKQPELSRRPDHRIPKDTGRQTDHPKCQTKPCETVKVAGKQQLRTFSVKSRACEGVCQPQCGKFQQQLLWRYHTFCS